MKKVILTLAIIAFAGSLSAQIYRSLSQFNGDMDKYLYFNFEDQDDAYVGKTFADIIEKLEIQPVGFTRIMEGALDMSVDFHDVWIELIFRYNHAEKKGSSYNSYIRIVWETPILSRLVVNLTDQYTNKIWVPQHYEFFKNMKVKYICTNGVIEQERGYKTNPEFEFTEKELRIKALQK